jgi:4a-hydroxytetrahydrobiopterin dehydratase
MDQEELTRTQVSAAVSDLGWRLILGALCTQVVTGSLPRGAEAAARLAVLGDGSGNLRMDIRDDRLLIAVQVFGPHDQARNRIEAALAAGGKIVYDAEAPAFWVLADPEGNEACVCTWQARD